MRCYECNSHNDLRCAEKEPPKELEKDCEEISAGNKYTFCRKITQVIEFSVNSREYKIHINKPFILIYFFQIVPPDTRTIRSCGFEAGNYANRCYQRSGFGGRQEVCACEGELCNSAVKLRTTFGVVLSILVAIIARI